MGGVVKSFFFFLRCALAPLYPVLSCLGFETPPTRAGFHRNWILHNTDIRARAPGPRACARARDTHRNLCVIQLK